MSNKILLTILNINIIANNNINKILNIKIFINIKI